MYSNSKRYNTCDETSFWNNVFQAKGWPDGVNEPRQAEGKKTGHDWPKTNIAQKGLFRRYAGKTYGNRFGVKFSP